MVVAALDSVIIVVAAAVVAVVAVFVAVGDGGSENCIGACVASVEDGDCGEGADFMVGVEEEEVFVDGNEEGAVVKLDRGMSGEGCRRAGRCDAGTYFSVAWEILNHYH